MLSLLGLIAFLHLVPESYKNGGSIGVFLSFLAGILAFFVTRIKNFHGFHTDLVFLSKKNDEY
jgi:hypothetical protein